MLDLKVRDTKLLILETYTTNRRYKLLGNNQEVFFY